MEPNSLDPSHAEREQRPLILEPPELALNGLTALSRGGQKNAGRLPHSRRSEASRETQASHRRCVYLALAFFSAALPLSIVKGTVVSGNWLTILWTAFGVSLAIGLMSLDAVWNSIKSVRTRVPYEFQRKRASPAQPEPPTVVPRHGDLPTKPLEESAPTSSAQELVIAPETTRPAHRRRGPFGEDSYFPQVLVTNGGTEPAEGVRVEIVSWKHRTGNGLFKDPPTSIIRALCGGRGRRTLRRGT